MYLLRPILWSLPLLLYAVLRVRGLFPRRWLGNVFVAVFALLVAGFPLTDTLSRSPSIRLPRLVKLAGCDSLPFVLYVVLFVVASDVLVGLLRLSRILSRSTVGRPWFRALRLGVVLGAPAVVVVLGALNFQHIQVRSCSIEVPRRSSGLDRLRIVFAADFHLGERTAPDFMDRFVDLVNAQAPDVVLLGGDLVEGHRGEDLEGFEAGFRRIRARYGLFAVPGNHERHGGGGRDFFARAGIRLLEDEVVRVAGAFCLAGRKDDGREPRKPIAELLEGATGDLPVIVLDHRPTDLEAIRRSGADLSFSGHTHHGQLFPVNLITQHVYELDWGHERRGRTHVFVTSGVQLWGPPVRTVGASEILVVDVAFRDGAEG